MIRTNLSIAAEILRREIKQIIPETAGPLPSIPENQSQQVHVDMDEDVYGIRNYTGSLLETKCTQLLKAMGVGNWGYRVAHFPGNTAIKNDRKEMYLVPLSKGFTLTPGGLLSEGTYTYVTHDMNISKGTAVFIVPE